jgi:hypothetical protein
MAMLNSTSSRFSRSLNYTMPECRPTTPKGLKSRISVVLSTGPVRTVTSGKGRTSDER